MARNKFDTDEEIEQKFNPHILLRLSKWIKPYAKWMVLSCIIMLVSSAISLCSPYLTRMAIDKAIPDANYRLLVIISVALFLSTLLVRVLLAEKLKIMTRVAQKIIVNIRHAKSIPRGFPYQQSFHPEQQELHRSFQKTKLYGL